MSLVRTIQRSLRKALIIPDVLPDTFTPSALVTVALPGVNPIERSLLVGIFALGLRSGRSSVANNASVNAYPPLGPQKGIRLHRYSVSAAFMPFREPPNFSLPADSSELDPSIEPRRRWTAVPVEFT
ncbi:hypothetical protein C8F01DRAFT_1265451 [Mycena amicta]|nr:hypothetical protein C8F01DRAFT_1265451 [Mycena amicta]